MTEILKGIDKVNEKKDIISNSKDQRKDLANEVLQTYSYDKFLKMSFENRLQCITKHNVEFKNIADLVKKKLCIIEFNFTSNGKENIDLRRKTTAGQVLPPEVGEVECDGVKYIRDNLKGEFFAFNGSRLKILQGTQIEIKKLRDISEMKKSSDKKAEEYIEQNKGSEEFKDIIKEASERGFNIETAIKSFGSIISTFGLMTLDRKSTLEDLFTEEDRKKGNKNYSEKIDLNNITPGIKGLLDFISIRESGGNYNAIFGDTHQNNIDFTNYSLRDILSFQENRKKEGKQTAIGKYQFINSTLSEMIYKYDFDLDQKFSPEFQDKIATIKLKKRGLDDYLSGDLDRDGFQKKLSKEWASLPKDSSGLSFYDGDGINKAHYSNNEVDKILDNLYKTA